MDIKMIKVKQGAQDILVPIHDMQDVMSKIPYGKLVNCHVVSVPEKRERSYEQLSTYWGACGFLAEQADEGMQNYYSWNTKTKVDRQVKLGVGHVGEVIYHERPNGEKLIHFELESISYAELTHLEACRFFGDAFGYMCQVYNAWKNQDLPTEDFVEMVKMHIRQKTQYGG